MKTILTTIVSLTALFLVSCERDTKPPADVLESALQNYIGNGKLIEYSVTNHYTRQIKDEQFQIVEFDLEYIGAWEKIHANSRHTRKKLSLALVKRGNAWRHQQWQD